MKILKKAIAENSTVTDKEYIKERKIEARKKYKNKEIPLTPPEKTPGISDDKYIVMWENWFWADYCDFCKSCNNECKQSWQATIAICQKYSPMKGNNKK